MIILSYLNENETAQQFFIKFSSAYELCGVYTDELSEMNRVSTELKSYLKVHKGPMFY
jgi:hypothetical protein